MTYLIGFYESTVKYAVKSSEDVLKAAIPEVLLGALLITINVVPLAYFLTLNIWHMVIAPAVKTRHQQPVNLVPKKTDSLFRARPVAVAPAVTPEREAGPGQAGTLTSNKDMTAAPNKSHTQFWE